MISPQAALLSVTLGLAISALVTPSWRILRRWQMLLIRREQDATRGFPVKPRLEE